MKSTFSRLLICLLGLVWVLPLISAEKESNPPLDQVTPREPGNEEQLKKWLQNMVWYHHFTLEEISLATGLAEEKIERKLDEYKISAETRPALPSDELLMLPYPGGRHPRIGFLEGAIDPERETKISLFTPWDEKSYVVMDLPEAIWSNLGLTYLAHIHIPTIWAEAGHELQPQEWEERETGTLFLSRTLPNGIRYEAEARVNHSTDPDRRAMLMKLTLTNGTTEPLSDLRIQNCVMLKGAPEFAELTNDNKVFQNPFVVCHSSTADRYIITAWERCVRPWGNVRCPCLHSDPQFPDLAPGESATIKGWLSFYQGDDLDAELKRIKEDYLDVE
ncbi:MAG: hypothetical protein R3C11_13200 [Planctomycetaceae bacterium]